MGLEPPVCEYIFYEILSYFSYFVSYCFVLVFAVKASLHIEIPITNKNFKISEIIIFFNNYHTNNAMHFWFLM